MLIAPYAAVLPAGGSDPGLCLFWVRAGLFHTRVLCGLWQPDDTLQLKERAAGEAASSSEESTGLGSGPVLSQVHLEQQLLPEASCFFLQL